MKRFEQQRIKYREKLNRLVRLIDENGIKQIHVAAGIGCSQSVFNDLLHERFRSMPKVEKALDFLEEQLATAST